MSTKGNGKSYQWLQAHASYPHAGWCLVWPFARDKHGRGMLGYNGKGHWAHRLMCTLAHGEAPTPKHTAAHSCGCGHEGCVNPMHLEWKTQAENIEDCRTHGTLIRHHGGNVRRLMPEQIASIRGARGFQTQGQLAVRFGVSESTISDIWHGRSHVTASKIKHWSAEEDEKLIEAIRRGYSIEKAGQFVGRTQTATSGRMSRLGLKSGWVRPSSVTPTQRKESE